MQAMQEGKNLHAASLPKRNNVQKADMRSELSICRSRHSMVVNARTLACGGEGKENNASRNPKRSISQIAARSCESVPASKTE
jgi:hypothetical protein